MSLNILQVIYKNNILQAQIFSAIFDVKKHTIG